MKLSFFCHTEQPTFSTLAKYQSINKFVICDCSYVRNKMGKKIYFLKCYLLTANKTFTQASVCRTLRTEKKQGAQIRETEGNKSWGEGGQIAVEWPCALFSQHCLSSNAPALQTAITRPATPPRGDLRAAETKGDSVQRLQRPKEIQYNSSRAVLVQIESFKLGVPLPHLLIICMALPP